MMVKLITSISYYLYNNSHLNVSLSEFEFNTHQNQKGYNINLGKLRDSVYCMEWSDLLLW